MTGKPAWRFVVLPQFTVEEVEALRFAVASTIEARGTEMGPTTRTLWSLQTALFEAVANHHDGED